MSIFQTVKDHVSTREAAERYGLQVSRHGMCQCPFHSDRNPSMKVDRRFHCFGCQADGDVIDFTSRFFNISRKDAALKLASDFGIAYDSPQFSPSVRKQKEISKQEIFAHQNAHVFRELADRRNDMADWLIRYAPRSPEEEFHPRYHEAILGLSSLENDLDILLSDNEQEKQQIIEEYLNSNRNHKEEPILKPIVDIPVYPYSAAHARESGELEQYRKSHFANIDCKNAIEHSIQTHFDGFRLDRNAIDSVMERYGPERVSLVLAATVQTKVWDGRFSNANKDWAFTFDFPDPVDSLGFDRRDRYAVNSHPAVLDGFINHVRQDIKARERSMEPHTEALALMPQDKPARHKTFGMER